MTGDQTFTVRRPDRADESLRLTGRADDSNVVRNIVESGGLYEPHVVLALARHLEPDDVVLDVGAHIGVIASLAARMVPQGHVHAFEASAQNFDYLQRNLAANGLTNVTAERVAVYDGSIDHLELSVAADNTSGFNCRTLPGSTSWSEHAYGRAIDINPVENPEITGGDILPPSGAPFTDRHDAPGLIHAGDVVGRAFAAQGWRWGGSWQSPIDYQHFSTTGR